MNIQGKNKMLGNLSAFLFWDVDRKTIDYNKHSPYIIGRVLSMGTMEDFKIIKALYGKPKIKHITQQLRYMDDRVLYFCSAYFNVPVTQFRCYILKQSNPAHWSY